MQTDLIQTSLLILVLSVLAWPFGRYLARVYRGEPVWSDFLRPFERLIFKLSGVNAETSLNVAQNMKAMLRINLIFFVWAFVLLLFQGNIPLLNPDGVPGMTVHQSFHTAVSFLTNTNLQHYSGETGAAYLAQMLVFTFLQFVSAGTGMAAAVLIWQSIRSQRTSDLGNFYHYLMLSITRILLPLALVTGFVLLLNGVPATLEGAGIAHTLEGEVQTVARGPVASMVAIKQLGTNGGGFFGSNSTHPLENPNVVTNIVEWMSILFLPMAMVFGFGYFTGKRKFARILFAVMMAGFLMLFLPTLYLEGQGTNEIAAMGISQSTGNMEGKEVRFGPGLSSLWAVATTCTSNGSVNAMHDSFQSLSGTFLLLGMMVNAFFGGVGVGFINMYVFVILAVFISGLMVGRTPELWGKKLESGEIKLAALVFLMHPFLILGFTAVASGIAARDPAMGVMDGGQGLNWLNNPGFHGFTEMLYEFTSSAANNGSGFEGLGDNTVFWNLTTGLVILLSRFIPIVIPLMIAGYLAHKKSTPAGPGNLQVESRAFGLVLWFVILILSALAFFPALALGPLAGHFS